MSELILIKEDLEVVISSGDRRYGPFKRGEIVEVPLSIANKLVASEIAEYTNRPTQYVLVVFLKDVPSRIVGTDLKVYGPFNAGDLAYLPIENVEAFKMHDVVELVKEEADEKPPTLEDYAEIIEAEKWVIYKCKATRKGRICGYEFLSREDLLSHLKAVHGISLSV
ncbi:MAG: hypothetical protein QXP84_05820 [Candidatus Korarchaeum sp.]